MWGGGGAAQFVRDLNTKSGCVQLHAKTALPTEESSWYILNGMLGGSNSWFGPFGEENSSAPPGI